VVCLLLIMLSTITHTTPTTAKLEHDAKTVLEFQQQEAVGPKAGTIRKRKIDGIVLRFVCFR
jgi:hypothetical protein